MRLMRNLYTVVHWLWHIEYCTNSVKRTNIKLSWMYMVYIIIRYTVRITDCPLLAKILWIFSVVIYLQLVKIEHGSCLTLLARF